MARKKNYKKSRQNAYKAGKTLFYKCIKPQEFSLPVSFMKYLWKTPSNPRGYQKLIQTCKLFFAKNSILVFPSLFSYEGFTQSKYWTYCAKKHCKCYEGFDCKFQQNIYLEKINCKIWPTFDLDIRYTPFPKILMSKIYRSDAKQVMLVSDKNYLKDVILLASSAVDLALTNGVLDDDGQYIFVENYIDNFPLLESFAMWWKEGNPPPCKNFEKLLTLLQKKTFFNELDFRSLRDNFALGTLPYNFNVQACLENLKQSKTQFRTLFEFADGEATLPEIQNRLEKIVDEIIETKEFDYCPPNIWFKVLYKQNWDKYKAMCSKIDYYCSKTSMWEKAHEENAMFDKINKII